LSHRNIEESALKKVVVARITDAGLVEDRERKIFHSS
jgi:hypothetical protein